MLVANTKEYIKRKDNIMTKQDYANLFDTTDDVVTMFKDLVIGLDCDEVADLCVAYLQQHYTSNGIKKAFNL